MKFISSRLLAAVFGLAGLFSTANATRPYTNGDLLLGFRASADPGSTQDYVVNLGPASQFTQATEAFVVSGLGNIATDLVATFSETGVIDWHARADLFWGVVGTDLAADPANTLYATRPRAEVATQTVPWERRSYSSQSTTNSTIRAFISGYTLSDANAASPKGTIQPTSAINSYASFTSGGTDFGFFSGIEGTFATGTAGSVLDLYRLTPTTQNPAGAGLIFVGSFQLNNAGQLTFTPTTPTAPAFRFSATTYSVSEAAGAVSVRVVRTGLTTGTDTVQFDTSNGTGIAGTDYTAKAAFVVNFAPGETQVDVPVDVVNIPGLQPNRTFNVALSNPSAGSLGTPSTGVVTITDSTPQNFGQFSFSAAASSYGPVNSQGQPNTLDIVIARNNGSEGSVSVDVSVATGGTLTSGTDFTLPAATVQFAAGELTKGFSIQLATLADSKLPGTINLTLSNPQGGATLGSTINTTVTVTARDNAKPTFTLTSKSGKVTSPAFQIAGIAKDNVDIDRVEVKVSGGAAQLANLGPLTNGSRSIDLSGVTLENGKNTIVVTAFDSSGNAAKSITLKLTYTNSRPALAGNYNGLLTAVATPTSTTTGFVSLKVSPVGLFTGKVTIANAVVPIKGIFDNAGAAHFNVAGDTATAPTDLALSKKIGETTTQFGEIALAIATGKITGTLEGETADLANIDADRAFFDGKTPATTVPATYLANKGSFTVIFPARATQVGLTTAQFPQGDGFGSLKVTSKGIATLKGTLADGTPLSASAPLSETLRWPLFARLYKSLGVIAGPVTFDDTQADSDLKGTDILWIRPAIAGSKHYPDGWPASILVDAIGSKYGVTSGASVLPGLGTEDTANGNANLEFFDGKLTAPVIKTVNVSTTNKVNNAPADKTFSLKLTTAKGLIAGKFPHSDSTSPAFKGAIFQKGSNAGGFGFFLSTVPKGGPSGESGAVTLQAK